jgi:hypothetical protein
MCGRSGWLPERIGRLGCVWLEIATRSLASGSRGVRRTHREQVFESARVRLLLRGPQSPAHSAARGGGECALDLTPGA